MTLQVNQLFGVDAHLYYCAAGIGGTPSWTEFTGVKDVEVKFGVKKVDITRRSSGGIATAGYAINEMSVTATIPLDPTSSVYQALRLARMNKTPIGIAAMTQLVTTTGSEGPWFDALITEWNIGQKLEDAQMVSITFDPTNTGNTPLWKVVGTN
jgi:hypothetical protein